MPWGAWMPQQGRVYGMPNLVEVSIDTAMLLQALERCLRTQVRPDETMYVETITVGGVHRVTIGTSRSGGAPYAKYVMVAQGTFEETWPAFIAHGSMLTDR